MSASTRASCFAMGVAFAWLAATRADAAPCAGFTDVDTAGGFCTEVTWIKNRGVTLGCTATQYCPNADVTRLQMALFMYRLGNALFPSNCTPGQVMKWNGTAWACAADSGGAANAFVQGGNAFGGIARFGTNDDQPIEVEVNGARVLRIEPNAVSPNIMHGYNGGPPA